MDPDSILEADSEYHDMDHHERDHGELADRISVIQTTLNSIEIRLDEIEVSFERLNHNLPDIKADAPLTDTNELEIRIKILELHSEKTKYSLEEQGVHLDNIKILNHQAHNNSRYLMWFAISTSVLFLGYCVSLVIRMVILIFDLGYEE
jgi:chromosome segregation ATPase